MSKNTLTAEDILHQDDLLLVLNKPAAVPVHGSRMLEGRPQTLLAMAREQTGRMVHAVHRLDRPVSGAVMLTFDKNALAEMSAEFSNRRVGKSYLGVVRGWTREEGVIDYPLLPPRDERRGEEQAREARTRFTCLAKTELPIAVPPYQTARYSLLQLVPETGRRHQLRRHMKHISHHLVGDTTYGRGEHNRLFRGHFACERLLLHSHALTFNHPCNGEQIKVTAPLDADFDRVMEIFSDPGDAGVPTDKP
ncbi:MAG: pseudouridine synthase [Xanthomonadales bacterium]|jgi:tRNA pseudouridine65 synthase|nr:pseudouridine synthase [Xanthomonadales bacterium]